MELIHDSENVEIIGCGSEGYQKYCTVPILIGDLITDDHLYHHGIFVYLLMSCVQELSEISRSAIIALAEAGLS